MATVYALIMWSWVVIDPAHGPYVDVIGADVPAAAQLVAKYPDDARIPADEPLLPHALRAIDSWTVVSRRGPHRRAVRGISIRRGTHRTHVLYWLDAPRHEQGLATTAPLPTAGRLRALEATAPAKAVRRKLMRSFLDSIPDRDGFSNWRPADGDIDVVRMTTRKGHVTLASVHIPQDNDLITGYAAGVALLADDGAVIRWLSGPVLDLVAQLPLYLVDLQGDGTDALVFDDAAADSRYRTLLTFDAAGEPRYELLTGDGP